MNRRSFITNILALGDVPRDPFEQMLFGRKRSRP